MHKAAVRALAELHKAGAAGEAMVHRNLTPRTILVKYDNSPILTGFDRTKIPSDITVASSGTPSREWDATASPEVRALGLSVADFRSDVYSLCACLTPLFQGRDDETSRQAVEVFAKGMAEEPGAALYAGSPERVGLRTAGRITTAAGNPSGPLLDGRAGSTLPRPRLSNCCTSRIRRYGDGLQGGGDRPVERKRISGLTWPKLGIVWKPASES